MKLDEMDDTTSQVNIVSKKKSTPASQSGNVNSILDMLNPLKSININSDLHSFYSFRESKESVEALLKAQTNLVFYVIHQNFMCDAAHKDFFKNMVGRFYDLPERFWGYYRGVNYFSDSENEALSGLVLLENGPLYLKALNGEYNVIKYRFKAENAPKTERLVFNIHSLLHFHGIENSENKLSRFYFPFNRNNEFIEFTKYNLGMLNTYECGRFKPNNDSWFGNYYDTKNEWRIISTENILRTTTEKFLREYFCDIRVYASLGIDRMDEIITLFKDSFSKANITFNDSWIPHFNQETTKKIRSLSQTFNWTKEYILQNEEKLNLDVLGLNMTVPWDLELVKFFIKRGYGGRMSENKAVFDRVFKPLLTDEILDMLFRLEYQKY